MSASDACLHMNGSKTSQQTLPAVSTSVTSLLPSYERCGSEPHMLNRFKEILGLPGVGDERDDPLSENSMVTQSSSSCGTVPVHVLSQRSIAPFLLEMQDWRPLYINNREMHHTGIAGRIISELGMSEITITAATGSSALPHHVMLCHVRRIRGNHCIILLSHFYIFTTHAPI